MWFPHWIVPVPVYWTVLAMYSQGTCNVFTLLLMRIQLLLNIHLTVIRYFNEVFTMYVQCSYKDTWGYILHWYLPGTHKVLAMYSHLTGCWWLWIQLLPEDTSCTGPCEGLLRSHGGVRATPPLLRPGDGDGDHDVFKWWWWFIWFITTCPLSPLLHW